MKPLIIICLVLTCIPNSIFGQNSIDQKSKDSILFLANNKIFSDSLYVAKEILEDAINIANRANDSVFLGNTYRVYGNLFLNLKDYDTALKYFNKSIDAFPLESKDQIFNSLTNISIVYTETKEFNKLDSISSFLINNSYDLSDFAFFYASSNLIYSFRDRLMFKQVIDSTESVLNKMNSFNFSKTPPSRKEYIKTTLKAILETEQVYAMIELNYPKHIIYPKLIVAKKDILKYIDWERNYELGKLYEYKVKYFAQYEKNIDSVMYYTSLSNAYKKKDLEATEEKAGQSSKLIYSIVEKEEELKRVSLLNKNKETVLKLSKRGNMFLSALLLIAIIFGAFIYRTGRYRIKVNKVLKKQNLQLLSLDKERTEFFSVMTHELRTPLYSIVGLNKLINSETDEAVKSSYFKTLNFSSQHLLHLVNNIIELIRFNLKNIKLKQDHVKINTILKNVINSFAYELDIKHINLHTDIDNSLLNSNVIVDQGKLYHVFVSLLNYAISYAPNGNIWIEIKGKNYHNNKSIDYNFKIKHDGEHIPEHMQEKLFKRFKGDNSLNEGANSLNLGLYVVKRILNLYDSSITFLSSKKDGTSFEFSLTLDVVSAIKIDSNNKESHTPSLQGHKILAVDDNKINLMITKKIIEAFKADCDIINNGFDAIKLVKNNKYSLILMDINMPEIDGFESTKAIREFNKTIPIIALTAVDYNEIKNKVFDYGMNQIISKPFKAKDLYNQIAMQIAS